MRIWLREVFGVLLILAGLAAGGTAVWFLYQGYIIEGAALVFLSVMTLNAGTHLLKVALAVHVLLRDSEKKRGDP